MGASTLQICDCDLRVAVSWPAQTNGPDQGGDQKGHGDGYRSAASDRQTQPRAGGGARNRGQADDDHRDARAAAHRALSDDEGIEPGVIRLDVGLRDGELDTQKDQQGA